PTLPAPLPPRDPAREGAENALLAALRGASANGRSLADALRDIEPYRAQLERATQTYTTGDPSNPPRADMWPPASFVFRLSESGLDTLFATIDAQSGTSRLEQLVRNAMPPPSPRAPLPPPAALPVGEIGGTAYFVIRCLYECPGCGGLRPPVLSGPTLAFELASFFDPDAPARPIRIALPIDSTPGGLRKYTRSVALLLSDQLACQKARLGGLTFGDLVLSVLPWPFHKDLPADRTACGAGNNGLGVICSLSIPIITICALILLIIIVSLLDLVFRWIPYFIMCFPLPDFKGKR
ncbi:MAG: hypothetical protein N2378_16715, partial [Chloroflexaceae bacterium]|nr:hypothetical protein [Chloroflexaceae bacterium]